MLLKKGTLKSFNATSYRATVALDGSLSVWLDVPVSRDIASADLVAGRSVAIVFLDPTDPNDAVLFAVWV